MATPTSYQGPVPFPYLTIGHVSTFYATPPRLISSGGGVFILDAVLPSGVIPKAYSQTLTAGGGTAGYTFAVTSGSLPAGLSLNGSTGVISGTPTTVGSSTFTVTATDSLGTIGTQSFTIAVTGASGGAFTYLG